MKKVLLFAAAASVAFTSCVKDEPAGITASDSKISFEAPAVSGITRAVAGEIPSTYPKTENFSVYARYFSGNYTAFTDGTPYMTNVKTAYNSTIGTKGGWDTESVLGGQAYYWPKNGTLTFAAYSPSDAAEDFTSVNWDAQGFTFENFTVKQDPAEHYDLMFSERSYDRTSSTGGTTYDGVDINFKHALSSIVFQVKKMEEYTGHTITVTGITLKNAYETGTFKQGLADNGTATTTAAAWSGQTNEYNAGYSVLTADEVVASTTATKLVNVTPLIILPQATAHGTGANNIMIAVNYTIDNGTGVIEQSANINVADGAYNLSAFELGKRYTFTLIFGLNKIYFSPEVEVWDDEPVTPDINL